MKKAITHLKFDRANDRKRHKLDELSVEYLRVVQRYINWLIDHQQREPKRYAPIPEAEIPTALSDRWQRCGWQQACGIVQSWYSNERTNRPVLHNLCIQANANVVKIEPPEKASSFDLWLRISTLDKGKPVLIPLTLYGRAQETLTQFPKLCSSVTLNCRDGEWYATLVVEKRGPKAKTKEVIGHDIGLVNILSNSTGQRYGQISPQLRQRVEHSQARYRRKQKLNACLKRKGLPTVNLSDQRTEAFARNEIGRALNQMLNEFPERAAAALEKLSVKDMKFKSRQMNRVLRAGQLGYIRDRLKFKLDERGIRYRSVQPAYSSQECSQCGFTFSLNRRTQADFECLWCGFRTHADHNASVVIAERFDDEALNALPFREVQMELALRFLRQLLGAGRASAGLELQSEVTIWLPRGKVVVPVGQPPPTVNQPS
ncbi:MAG: transposase [Anaerolineae bacterium]|nr:transposase [Anaerolineae bacterium]